MRQKNLKTMAAALLIAVIFLAPLSAVEKEATNEYSQRNTIATTSAGQPTVEWNYIYGGDEFDAFRCIQQTSDGGYIAFGEQEIDDMNYAWLLKLDADGDEEWSIVNQDLNGSTYDEQEVMHYVIETSDDGYIALGHSWYYYADFGVWGGNGFLWKVDASGNTEWLKQDYYNLDEGWLLAFMNIIEVEDGFMVGGLAAILHDPETFAYTLDGMLMKTDKDGTYQWHQSYDGGREFEYFPSLCATDDGGFFLSGGNADFGYADGTSWMLKTDGDGNKQWDQVFDGPGDIDLSSARGCGQADDGGYIMCGITNSYGAGKWDLWIIKTDATGTKEWDKTFGGSGYDQCFSMQRTSDGGYIFGVCRDMGGYMGTQDDTWIIKTDADGNAEWKYQIEESGRQQPSYIAQTDDGGFIAAGRTGSPDEKSTDAFIVKVGAFDNDRPDKPATPSGPASGTTGEEHTYSSSVTDPDGDQVYFRWDWGDGNYSEWLGPYNSGETCEATHTWTVDGTYSITVTAKDEHDGDSDTSDPLPVSMPMTYQPRWITLLEHLWTLLTQFLTAR